MGENAHLSSRSRISPYPLDAEPAGFLHEILEEVGIALAGEKVCVRRLTEIRFCERKAVVAVGFAFPPDMPSVTTSDLIANRHWICQGTLSVVDGCFQE